MTYGEIHFESLAECFAYIKNKYDAFPSAGGTFIDLGHGTGKGVLAACLMHRFEKCMGIELLESLYETSEVMKEEYDTYIEEVEKAGGLGEIYG